MIPATGHGYGGEAGGNGPGGGGGGYENGGGGGGYENGGGRGGGLAYGGGGYVCASKGSAGRGDGDYEDEAVSSLCPIVVVAAEADT